MARYGKILMLAALVGLLVTDFEGHAGPSSTPGVTVTRPVPSAMESLSDVQARAPFLQTSSPRDRYIPFRRIPRPAETAVFAPQLSLRLAPAVPFDPPAPMAPALDTSFAGLGNPTPDVIPPDTMGAAGPTHLVSLLNSEFGVFYKTTGALVSSVSMGSFWASLGNGTGQPAEFPFDPKILYDTNSGRFVAITLSADGTPPSWIMIAMSQNSDPLGIWYKVAIRADVGTDNTYWADYPGLGVDTNNIYITANMFDTAESFQGSKVWVVSKSEPLLNGRTDNLIWTEFRHPRDLGDSMQPAHTFGAAPAEYFIREAGSGALGLATITGGTTWTDLGPIQVNSFTSTSMLPGAPQFGDARAIDTGDTRLLNAVFRNGSLWTTHNVLGASGKVEVAWYQVAPGSPTPAGQGRINDPNGNRWYFYPSIAVNTNSDVAIGFNGSSSIEYASGYYAVRRSTDSPGTIQPPSLLKTGVASYFKTGATLGGSGTENRWGDFSATVVDPSDNLTFWTLQEYAATPRPSDGRSMWGTWWGKFRPPAIASSSLTAIAVSTTQVDLSWTIPAGQGQTGFRVERRQLPGGNFGAITVPDLGPGILAYIDNTGTAGITYSYRVRALSAGGDSYSNETTATTVSPPPAPPVGGGGGGGCVISSGNTREGDFSPLATVLILLSPVGIHVIRRHLICSSR